MEKLDTLDAIEELQLGEGMRLAKLHGRNSFVWNHVLTPNVENWLKKNGCEISPFSENQPEGEHPYIISF